MEIRILSNARFPMNMFHGNIHVSVAFLFGYVQIVQRRFRFEQIIIVDGLLLKI